MRRYRDYDPFAWLYTNQWGDDFHRQIMPVLIHLVLDHVAKKAHILDLCCGDGRVTQKLSKLGYRVTGIDGSEEMLTYAQQRSPKRSSQSSPKVQFLLQDARKFHLPPDYDAVISTFDSLNHIMNEGDLHAVFANAHACLKPGGRFVFDLNRESAYREFWARSSNSVGLKAVSTVNGAYDEKDKLAHCDITLFRLEGSDWRRSDFRLTQRFHPEPVVRAALERAGFAVKVYEGVRDLGMYGEIGEGRDFYVAVKGT